MALAVKCGCGRELLVKDGSAGRRVRCPSCGEPIRIPRQSGPGAEVPSAPASAASKVSAGKRVVRHSRKAISMVAAGGAALVVSSLVVYFIVLHQRETTYDGRVDKATYEVIHGWAWDKRHPDTPIAVDIYDGDTLLGTVKADLTRVDLENAGIGDGRHAFSFRTPDSVNDLKNHVICARVAGTNIKVGGKLITPAEGYHESADAVRITGWAWDRSRPDTPIKVDIYDGDRLLGTVTADQFRKDLVKAGKGNGKHGFLYATPSHVKDGRQHVIRVKIAGTDIELNKTRKVIRSSSK
jgi:hypothetical protein